jgi:hypothetical protein
MSVLIEGISIVVPMRTIERRHDGGFEDFRDWVSGLRWCHDEHLAAVHFQKNETVGEILGQLNRNYISVKDHGRWETVAVVHQRWASALAPCDWLTIGRNPDGAVFACLKGQEENPGNVSVPAGWEFEGSLSQRMPHVPLDKASNRFKFLRSEGLSRIYLDRETGFEVPAGQVKPSSEVTEWRARLRRPEGEIGDGQGTGRGSQESPPPIGEIVTVEMAFVDQREEEPDLTDDELMEEQVRAVRLSPNRYRLEQNPMLTEMAGYKDTVEGNLNKYDVFVVERVVDSELRTIRTNVPRMFYFSDFGKAFLDSVLEAGGMWDILFWGIFTYNLPEDRVEEFEEAFQVACREASLLGKDEKRMPGDIYRQRPEGGAGQTEENN